MADNYALERGDVVSIDVEGTEDSEKEVLLPQHSRQECSPHRSQLSQSHHQARTCRTTLPLLASFVLGVLLTTLLQHICPTCILFASRFPNATNSQIPSTLDALADSSAGSTTHHPFPPPSPTLAPTSLFPTSVGYAGATPTGGEPFLLGTAPSYPSHSAVPNLIRPPALLGSSGKDTRLPGEENTSFNLFRSFGNLSPWYSVPSSRFGGPLMKHASGIVPTNREGKCEITGLHLLHRHGARYPTNWTTYGGPSLFASRIRAANRKKEWTAHGKLEFLNKWTYKLGEEILTPFGRQQLYDFGVSMRMKYGFLLHDFTAENRLPVFRTESQDRMLKSAKNFALGFFGWPSNDQYREVVMIEADGFNNTLAPYKNCPNASNLTKSDTGTPYLKRWTQAYLPRSVKRLNAMIKGYEFSIEDAYTMQQLCAYETVAIGYSKFCELFTEEEWEGFAYGTDLYFYYSSAFGSPLSRVQGVGFLIELLSRLTQEPVTHHWTSTNKTITDDRRTFPLDQTLYVDATHEVVILNVIAALGLTNFAKDSHLPATHIPHNRAFRTDELAPFASNVQFQLLTCADEPSIRIIINDGVTPLSLPTFPGCPPDPDGICPLSAFVEGLRKRIDETDWEWGCLGDWEIGDAEDWMGVNGEPPLKSSRR